MYPIKRYETAVTLFGEDGSVAVFKSKARALHALGIRWIRESVGRDFVRFSHHSCAGDARVPEPVYLLARYVMRDDFGGALTAADFEPLVRRRRYLGRYGEAWQTWSGEGPVPGVHKYRGGRYCHRRIRYAGALRQAEVVVEDGEVPARGKRSRAGLPNAWDDIQSSTWGHRSWKRFRCAQWRDSDKSARRTALFRTDCIQKTSKVDSLCPCRERGSLFQNSSAPISPSG